MSNSLVRHTLDTAFEVFNPLADRGISHQMYEFSSQAFFHFDWSQTTGDRIPCVFPDMSTGDCGCHSKLAFLFHWSCLFCKRINKIGSSKISLYPSVFIKNQLSFLSILLIGCEDGGKALLKHHYLNGILIFQKKFSLIRIF